MLEILKYSDCLILLLLFFVGSIVTQFIMIKENKNNILISKKQSWPLGVEWQDADDHHRLVRLIYPLPPTLQSLNYPCCNALIVFQIDIISHCIHVIMSHWYDLSYH